jgi:Carboxypeptidase regulatory-like domain
MIKFRKVSLKSITLSARDASNRLTRDLSMRTAIIMLAALPLLAADAVNGRFAGRVFDGEGAKQISRAIITVSTPSGYVSSVTTNKSGEFTFTGLPGGEYDFRVTAHNYAIYERQITVSADAGVKELDIRMLVPANKQTISVADLRKPQVAGPVSESTSTRSGY